MINSEQLTRYFEQHEHSHPEKLGRFLLNRSLEQLHDNPNSGFDAAATAYSLASNAVTEAGDISLAGQAATLTEVYGTLCGLPVQTTNAWRSRSVEALVEAAGNNPDADLTRVSIECYSWHARALMIRALSAHYPSQNDIRRAYDSSSAAINDALDLTFGKQAGTDILAVDAIRHESLFSGALAGQNRRSRLARNSALRASTLSIRLDNSLLPMSGQIVKGRHAQRLNAQALALAVRPTGSPQRAIDLLLA